MSWDTKSLIERWISWGKIIDHSHLIEHTELEFCATDAKRFCEVEVQTLTSEVKLGDRSDCDRPHMSWDTKSLIERWISWGKIIKFSHLFENTKLEFCATDAKRFCEVEVQTLTSEVKLGDRPDGPVLIWAGTRNPLLRDGYREAKLLTNRILSNIPSLGFAPLMQNDSVKWKCRLWRRKWNLVIGLLDPSSYELGHEILNWEMDIVRQNYCPFASYRAYRAWVLRHWCKTILWNGSADFDVGSETWWSAWWTRPHMSWDTKSLIERWISWGKIIVHSHLIEHIELEFCATDAKRFCEVEVQTLMSEVKLGDRSDWTRPHMSWDTKS
jgi:hypothetical protein